MQHGTSFSCASGLDENKKPVAGSIPRPRAGTLPVEFALSRPARVPAPAIPPSLVACPEGQRTRREFSGREGARPITLRGGSLARAAVGGMRHRQSYKSNSSVRGVPHFVKQRLLRDTKMFVCRSKDAIPTLKSF